jgi:hypothetical protein
MVAVTILCVLGLVLSRSSETRRIDAYLAADAKEHGDLLDRTLELQGSSLATFAKDNPKGKWIVVKRGHAVALIDGVYHDIGTDVGLPRSLVKSYYRAG